MVVATSLLVLACCLSAVKPGSLVPAFAHNAVGFNPASDVAHQAVRILTLLMRRESIRVEKDKEEPGPRAGLQEPWGHSREGVYLKEGDAGWPGEG